MIPWRRSPAPHPRPANPVSANKRHCHVVEVGELGESWGELVERGFDRTNVEDMRTKRA